MHPTAKGRRGREGKGGQAVTKRSKALLVCGVDEAGRGPLAGPLAVAAVILDPSKEITGLGDSKKLSAKKRAQLNLEIREKALSFFVVMVERDEIDRLNIFQATMEGMCRAVAGLSIVPREVLIDGNAIPKGLEPIARAIVGGDGIEASIMAASILAKEARDARMVALDAMHPEFGFAKHKGYPTKAHVEALMRLGPTSEHRESYAPVRLAKSLFSK